MILEPVLGILLLAFGSSMQGTPKTKFSCERRPSGYYADVETGCQVYHMCDGLGRQFSYSCPNATLFQQRMLICDHWYMVNCSKSETDYRANLLIGQRNKPFLEDSEKYVYDRTPRPDFLTSPKTPDYSLVHRNGRSQFASGFNLVGIETDHENNSSRTANQPSYSLPSYWFTEYSRTTPPQEHRDTSFDTKQLVKLNDISNKRNVADKIKLESDSNQNTKLAGFQKRFDINVEASIAHTIYANTSSTTLYQKQNTDVFSKKNDHVSVEKQKLKPQYVNVTHAQLSNMTPSVTIRSPETASHDSYSQNMASNLFKSTQFKVKAVSKKTLVQETKTSEIRWKDLRKFFLIPDYEFPLDSSSRPGYENGQSSFEVNPALLHFHKK